MLGNIDVLLDQNKSPLYFLDLINIINREWDVLKNIFELEKSRILFMLNEINEMRKDAHANSIDEDDFTQMRLYF